MYRIIDYFTESPKWLKAAKLTPVRYLIITSDYSGYIVQVFDDGKGEYVEQKHFSSLAEAVEAYKTYLKNRLIELLNNLPHEAQDDLEGEWKLLINEDFQYILSQSENIPDGFYLLGMLKELFKERQEKSEQWDLLLKDIESSCLKSLSSGD